MGLPIPGFLKPKSIPLPAQSPKAPAPAPPPKTQLPREYQGQSSFQVSETRKTTQGDPVVTNDGVKNSFGAEIKGAKGFGLQFKSEVQIKNEKRDGGYTTVGFEGQVSVGVTWGAEQGGSGAKVGGAVGVKTSYEVKMKDGDYEKVKRGEAPLPNPYDPSTLPVGAQVKIDGKNFESTEFEAAFRHVGVKTGTEDWRGATMAVEKTGENKVKVTYGPSEGVEQTLSVGVSGAGFEASFGGKKALEGYQLRTAEFDLATPEGKAAYQDFLATGTIPEKSGPGVSGVAKVETVKLEQTNATKLSGPGFEFKLEGGKGNGEATVTTFEDGSKAVKQSFETNTGVVTIERFFNVDGTEDKSKSKSAVAFPKADPGTAGYLATAFTGDEKAGNDLISQSGKHNTQVEFTSEQAAQLQERARAYLATHPNAANGSPTERFIASLAATGEFADPQLAVGAAFSRATSSGAASQALLELSFETPGGKLPGTFATKKA